MAKLVLSPMTYKTKSWLQTFLTLALQVSGHLCINVCRDASARFSEMITKKKRYVKRMRI